jgi:hypothetical protein
MHGTHRRRVPFRFPDLRGSPNLNPQIQILTFKFEILFCLYVFLSQWRGPSAPTFNEAKSNLTKSTKELTTMEKKDKDETTAAHFHSTK